MIFFLCAFIGSNILLIIFPNLPSWILLLHRTPAITLRIMRLSPWMICFLHAVTNLFAATIIRISSILTILPKNYVGTFTPILDFARPMSTLHIVLNLVILLALIIPFFSFVTLVLIIIFQNALLLLSINFLNVIFLLVVRYLWTIPLSIRVLLIITVLSTRAIQ